MLKKLKEKSGFISLEVIIVAGLMIGLGTFAITQFYEIGQEATDGAVDRISEIMDVTVTP